MLNFAVSGTRINGRGYLALILLCLCFYLPGLSSLPPTDRDESLFAEATKQMIETHDYVDINFLGTPRYKKPVGIYWLQAASVKLLNPQHLDEIWAYRVPSVMGATIAVLLTAALGALLFNPAAGLVAAIMLASCVDLNVEAHIAKTDAMLLAAVMLTQYALARAYVKSESGWRNALGFWSGIGIGILLKGPIVLLPVFSTLGWLRWKEKNLTWFSRLKPIAGLLYTLLLVMPWFIAINLASHGNFTAQAGGHDFLAKIWQGQDRGHVPPGAHALIFPIMFFPFSLFTLLALPDMWRNRNSERVRFCIGWIVPTWLVFELSLTKLPHYVLPAYPAIAVLTAKYMLDGFPALAAAGKRWWPGLATVLWLFIGTVFAFAAAVLPAYINHSASVPQIIASLLLLIAESLGLLFFMRGNKTASIGIPSLGAVIFCGTLFVSTLPGLQHIWMAKEIVAEAKKFAPCPTFKIVSAGFEEPSLAFLAGSETKLVPNGDYAASELRKDPCRIAAVNQRSLHDFLLSPSDWEFQPIPVGNTVKGFSTGNGGGMEMFFYILPPQRPKEPVYP